MGLFSKILLFFNIKKYEDILSYIINPILIFISFTIMLSNPNINNATNIQLIIIGLLFLFFIIIPIIKKIFRYKTISSHKLLYVSIVLNSALINNPIPLLVLLVPIIGKDSSLYLIVFDNIRKSNYYIYIDSFLKKDIVNDN